MQFPYDLETFKGKSPQHKERMKIREVEKGERSVGTGIEEKKWREAYGLYGCINLSGGVAIRGKRRGTTIFEGYMADSQENGKEPAFPGKGKEVAKQRARNEFGEGEGTLQSHAAQIQGAKKKTQGRAGRERTSRNPKKEKTAWGDEKEKGIDN